MYYKSWVYLVPWLYVNSGKEKINIDVNKTSVFTTKYIWLNWYTIKCLLCWELYTIINSRALQQQEDYLLNKLNQNRLMNRFSVGNTQGYNFDINEDSRSLPPQSVFLHRICWIQSLPLGCAGVHATEVWRDAHLPIPSKHKTSWEALSFHLQKKNITLCKWQIKIQH